MVIVPSSLPHLGGVPDALRVTHGRVRTAFANTALLADDNAICLQLGPLGGARSAADDCPGPRVQRHGVRARSQPSRALAGRLVRLLDGAPAAGTVSHSCQEPLQHEGASTSCLAALNREVGPVSSLLTPPRGPFGGHVCGWTP
jgi:hypothetical protein